MNYISNREQIQIYIGKFWRNFKNTKGWQVFLTSFIITAVACIVIRDRMEGTFLGFTIKLEKLDSSSWPEANFIFTSIAIWIGLFNSLTLICKERDIIKHEYREGMNLSAYISAHMIFQAFIVAIEALIVLVTIFLFYHQDLLEFETIFNSDVLRLVTYALTFFLLIFAADAMGLLISTLVKNVEQAMVVTPFVLLVQLVLSGNTVLSLLKVFSLLTISRYGLDSLLFLSGNNDNAIGDVVPIIVAWAALIAFSILFAYLAVRFLKSVENDERS